MQLIYPFPGLRAKKGAPIPPNHQVISGYPKPAPVNLSYLRIQNIAICIVVGIRLQVPDDFHPDDLPVMALVVLRAGFADRVRFAVLPGEDLYDPAEIPAILFEDFDHRSLFARLVIDCTPFSNN